ncbi:protein kinase [Strigomonas culicis]|uniref:non-specific serine/threonine protein kinase n=1 Tax=Strigomonas culicis TaxID=28005 RepID=S9UTK6_9TRYP|nr:protein kinase [Strigomonas culicis]EPY32218.1 protein kinase [Strigomonas culicis]|eukprot:EPY28384.1 protein kinase [Strigomonas culicis]
MGNGAGKGVDEETTIRPSNTKVSAAPATDTANTEAPIPLAACSTSTYTTLSDIFGAPGSTAKYIKRQAIGKGAYGEAFIAERNPQYVPSQHQASENQSNSNPLATTTVPRSLYVAKVMDLRAMHPQDRQYATTEIMCLGHTNHFAIVRYYEHFVLDSDDETVVIVTELADHGDLYRNLHRAKVVDTDANGTQKISCLQLTEREAGVYFVQVLLALHHIHKRRMIHRDVKSANLFLTSKGFMKLGDFGFSQKYESTVSSETIAGTFLGTPYYLSPEMWKGTRYGKKADVWACGVVLYEMLMDGNRPFDASGLPDLREAVLTGTVALPEGPPTDVEGRRGKFSPEMREFVSYVLQKDPAARPSTEELLNTPLMQHYLYVFERHVQSLIDADAAKRAANPEVDILELNFSSEEERDRVLQGIADGKAAVAQEIQREIATSSVPCYEGAVYKDSRNGVWKERYLQLADNTLTISLAKGKESATGERSKKVPLHKIKSVSPCAAEDAHVQAALQAQAPQQGQRFVPPFAFAISMNSSNSIVFGVSSEQELDNWLNTLMRALQMN